VRYLALHQKRQLPRSKELPFVQLQEDRQANNECNLRPWINYWDHNPFTRQKHSQFGKADKPGSLRDWTTRNQSIEQHLPALTDRWKSRPAYLQFERANRFELSCEGRAELDNQSMKRQ
jgi:hypothetical protein